MINMNSLQKIHNKRIITVHGYLNEIIVLQMAKFVKSAISYERENGVLKGYVKINYRGIRDESNETRMGRVPLHKILFITSTDVNGKLKSAGFLYDKNR